MSQAALKHFNLISDLLAELPTTRNEGVSAVVVDHVGQDAPGGIDNEAAVVIRGLGTGERRGSNRWERGDRLMKGAG
jgi:hypothetical protein